MEQSAKINAPGIADSDREILRRDFDQLREDLKVLKADMAAIGAERMESAKEALSEGLSTAETHAKEAVDSATSEMEEIQRQAERAVRKKPLTAIAAALAIGYFLAGLSRR